MKPRHEQALSAALLLAGGAIYLLFRPHTLLMFHVADRLGGASSIQAARALTGECHLPRLLTDCLPGGLWSAAYVLLIDSLLKRQSAKHKIVAASIIPLVGALSEVLQYWGILPGTFDSIDLLCYLLPLIIYIPIQLAKLTNS